MCSIVNASWRMRKTNSDHAQDLRNRVDSVLDAARDVSWVSGLTHGFYRYPARFSPLFARTAIDAFTDPGDLVLDPFMGGGTTVVEARTRGRRAFGSDTSSLAVFIARAKTTALTDGELLEIARWIEHQAGRPLSPREEQFTNDPRPAFPRNLSSSVTWRLRDFLQSALNDLHALATPRSQRFARAVLLRTAQWAVDTRRKPRSLPEVRKRLLHDVEEMSVGLQAFRSARSRADRAARITRRRQVVQQRSAEALGEGNLLSQLGPPRLVLTSPPYPGVHVLYHRWQIAGGKETPAPFWIAGERDGAGASRYTLADRHDPESYFERHEAAFTAIAERCDSRSVVVQLVAFADPTTQLPRYMTSMERAGFHELAPSVPLEDRWREVPNRRWYSAQRGRTPASKELVLFHAPVAR